MIPNNQFATSRITAFIFWIHQTHGTLPPMQLFMGLLISSMVLGDVWHVPEDCQTIQAAIDAAGDGDEIVVAAGVWKEQLEISGKTLLIRSESGAEETVIDAGQRGSTISCSGGMQSVLEGFTISGGHAEHGGGIISVDAQPTFRLCLIEFNTAKFGGGAYAIGGELQFDQCVFSFNTAENGDGVWAKNAKPKLTACIFAGDSIGWESGEMVTVTDTASPAGACCIGDTCVQTASVACWEAGGLYRGEDSSCFMACNPVCDEDVTGDGVVNMTDLLRVLAAFGFCP